MMPLPTSGDLLKSRLTMKSSCGKIRITAGWPPDVPFGGPKPKGGFRVPTCVDPLVVKFTFMGTGFQFHDIRVQSLTQV